MPSNLFLKACLLIIEQCRSDLCNFITKATIAKANKLKDFLYKTLLIPLALIKQCATFLRLNTSSVFRRWKICWNSQVNVWTVTLDSSFDRLFRSIFQKNSNFKNSKDFNQFWKALARCNRNKRLTSGIPTSGLFPEMRNGFRNPDVVHQHPAVISGKPEVPTMYI